MAGTEGAALATARPLRLGTLRTTQPSPTPASPSRAPRVSFRRRRRRNGHPARWTRDMHRYATAFLMNNDGDEGMEGSPSFDGDRSAGAHTAAAGRPQTRRHISAGTGVRLGRGDPCSLWKACRKARRPQKAAGNVRKPLEAPESNAPSDGKCFILHNKTHQGIG